LLGTAARERVRATATPERPFLDKVSTVIHGHRRFLEVADAKTTAGNAGLALDVSVEEDLRQELKRTIQSHAETLDHLATPVAIFDRDQRLQFHNQAFQRLWELDTPFLSRRPDNGEFLERLRADGKLPELHAWRDWKEQMLSVYRSVESTPHLWHLPDGQTLNVFRQCPSAGRGDLGVRKPDREGRSGNPIQHACCRPRARPSTIWPKASACLDLMAGSVSPIRPSVRVWGLTEEQVKPGTHIREIAEACEPSYREPDGWKLFAGEITSFR
jgi:PAS domain-containing protein